MSSIGASESLVAHVCVSPVDGTSVIPIYITSVAAVRRACYINPISNYRTPCGYADTSSVLSKYFINLCSGIRHVYYH